ncbi:aldo-keto reductase Mflv_4205 isoform X3 [Leptinotarsa decemlineata]|uniref:aldo-keto reductase Mflv_4205 isoform X3 n=1 Tax=Leptinotarsa decemlineata TaxID=7539 RepID=UPI003D30C394
MTSKDLTVTLNSGSVMPMVGLGTNGINGFKDILEVLDYAFEAGYRLIDTAAMYSNEGDIGRALKELLPKYNLSRKDIFITTKLHPQDQGQKATRALRKSLERLDCEYIDLYLINWPGSYGISSSSKENATLREKSWELMVEAVNEGLVKNIGVSSYTVKHLKKLLSNDYD